MLEAEIESSLRYAKHDMKNKPTTNSRKGYGKKTVRSENGDVDIFEPNIVKKHQSNVTGIEDQILAFYTKGVSTRAIQDHLQQLYGIEVSPTLMLNVTNKIVPLIKEWQNRPLQAVYAVVFLDAIHFKVKQDGAIVNKAALMVMGIDLDGHKGVLGIWIGENEWAKFWMNVPNELKNRGVQDILITRVDNLRSFTEAILECYPTTEIQKYVIPSIKSEAPSSMFPIRISKRSRPS
ncbi:IS256 family transposase [Brevibacillus borstelensis]|jgi:transposase-like protein